MFTYMGFLGFCLQLKTEKFAHWCYISKPRTNFSEGPAPEQLYVFTDVKTEIEYKKILYFNFSKVIFKSFFIK